MPVQTRMHAEKYKTLKKSHESGNVHVSLRVAIANSLNSAHAWHLHSRTPLPSPLHTCCNGWKGPWECDVNEIKCAIRPVCSVHPTCLLHLGCGLCQPSANKNVSHRKAFMCGANDALYTPPICHTGWVVLALSHRKKSNKYFTIKAEQGTATDAHPWAVLDHANSNDKNKPMP